MDVKKEWSNTMKLSKLINLKPLIITILSALFLLPLTVISLDSAIEWEEIITTKDGKQLWDRQSLIVDNRGFLNIKSEFIPNLNPKYRENISLVYDMRIDCKNKLFQDTSVNGQIGNDAKWLPDAGDIFIKATINKACSSLSNK